MPTVVCVTKAHGDADEFDSLCRERRIASSICLALMRRDNTFARQASSSRWNQSQHRLASPRLRLKLLFAPIHECVWLGQSIGIASVTCANPTDRISPNSVPFLTVHQSTYLAACLPACLQSLFVRCSPFCPSVCLSIRQLGADSIWHASYFGFIKQRLGSIVRPAAGGRAPRQVCPNSYSSRLLDNVGVDGETY